jgi:hypothetical protein
MCFALLKTSKVTSLQFMVRCRPIQPSQSRPIGFSRPCTSTMQNC